MKSTQNIPPATAQLPCDQCLHRKVRCDKSLPRCSRCQDTSLPCTRDVIRRRPGRKKGSGNVITQLRSSERSSHESENHAHEKNGTEPIRGSKRIGIQSLLVDEPLHVWSDEHVDKHFSVEASSPHTQLSGSPSSFSARSFLAFPNLGQYVDMFFENLYPIWPIIDEAAIREFLQQPDQLDYTQICLILSACALTALHIPAASSLSPEPRKLVAQRFIKECFHIRSQFSYIEIATVSTVSTSLFLSCAEVEFQKVRSSFFLLRESIMLAQELGFYEMTTTTPEIHQGELLCIRRTLFLLNLVERGLTILRNKPFAIVMFDSPPPDRFEIEDPRILLGLQCLSQLFNLIDKQFLDNWVNNTQGTPETAAHLLEAQDKLANMSFDLENLTNIQKVDILIAQQWLRLVFWQASMRQGLLSSTADQAALTYKFPCQIARSLCAVLRDTPASVISIHGMAIFERIFEIIYSFIDSLILSQNLPAGMDELRIVFKVLREAPNCHASYVQILETKLKEQADGESMVLLLSQLSPPTIL